MNVEDHVLGDFFTREGQRVRSWRIINIAFVLCAVLSLVFASRTPLIGSLCLLGLMMSEILLQSYRRQAEERLLSFLQQLEFDWDVMNSLNLQDDYMAQLHQAFVASTFEGMERTNPGEQRGRGSDDKGPALSKNESDFDASRRRVKPQDGSNEYADLEGPLRPSEHLVQDANERYATEAAKRWEEAEKSDPDLIEAGVDRLGDLVVTDWFEKNQQNGAVAEVMKSKISEDVDEHLQ